MSINVRNVLAGLFVPVVLGFAALAQQPIAQPQGTASKRIVLDVVVTPKSGPPVAGLTEKDFSVLDNKAGQPLTSFRAVSGNEAPLELIVMIDAVNTGFQNVAREREEIDKFLRADGGKLPFPTTIAVLNDTGVQMQQSATTDGNALSAALDKYTVALREIGRSAGYYGAEERLDDSLKAISQLTALERTRPGRKVVLWVSPGWPLLSGPATQFDRKQENAIFTSVVRMTNELREARITLYSIDPLGTADAGGLRLTYYKEFLKGPTKPDGVELGNLGLQVLAVQSGGLAVNSSNDTAALLQKCVADLQSYYEISYDAPPAERVNEYHQIEVKVGEGGLTARTRQGYYSQP